MMFYNARWYDPYLNHFSQPDSIVPVASQGTQAYDRYAYSNNNPIRYADPSGHVIDNGCRNGCGDSAAGYLILAKVTTNQKRKNAYFQQTIHSTIQEYGIKLPSGVEEPRYDPTLSSDSSNTMGQTDNRNIRIGDGAFSSANFLAATIYHETIHIQQEDEGRSYAGNYLEHQGPTMNEYEAYKKEYDWVIDNKLTLSASEMNNIVENKSNAYTFLRKENQALVDRKYGPIYVIDPSTLDYPTYPKYW